MSEDYSFEEFWHDRKRMGKKHIAHLAYCAMQDLFRAEERLEGILTLMDENFRGDQTITDMAPVWEVYDAIEYTLKHMEFDGEFDETVEAFANETGESDDNG